MNQPLFPPATALPASPPYELDPYGWAMAQADLIRARRLDALDWDNIAEEIESVGRSERRSLSGNLVQLILHMMKWDAQPERRSRSWFLSIRNHRADALRDLEENPSLHPLLHAIIAQATRDAQRRASDETHLPLTHFETLSYTQEKLFGRPFENPDR